MSVDAGGRGAKGGTESVHSFVTFSYRWTPFTDMVNRFSLDFSPQCIFKQGYEEDRSTRNPIRWINFRTCNSIALHWYRPIFLSSHLRSLWSEAKMFKSVLDMNFWDICSTRPSPINLDITEAGFDVITTLSLLHTHIYGVYYTHAHNTNGDPK